MTNRFASTGAALDVQVRWRDADTPCPESAQSESSAVTLSDTANIAHSSRLSQSLGDDSLLGVQMKVDSLGTVACKTVTGDGAFGATSVNGDYVQNGTYNGEPAYQSPQLHWLWKTAGGEWRLSGNLGNLYQYFTKDAPAGTINGTYSVGSNATGTPTVADGTTAKWTFAEDTDDEPPIVTVVIEYEVTSA
jgi:hypothetical protein